MGTKNLEAFVKTTELKSVTLSAKQLHLTQPAISKRLAALEVQLNTKLFTRRGLNLYLTPAGTVLLPFAKNVGYKVNIFLVIKKLLDAKVGWGVLPTDLIKKLTPSHAYSI